MFDLLIRNCLIVTGGTRPFRGSVGVRDEKIAAILEATTTLNAYHEIDARGKVLFPGIIDPHVHYRYKFGYRDASDGYLTETRSALVGGVTTAIHMHREQTPYPQHLPHEIKQLEAQSHIDMAFHLAIMTEEQLATATRYAGHYGINSFKLYLAYKGKAGQLQGLQGADDGFLYAAMSEAGRTPNGIVCVHAENSEITERLGDGLRARGRNDLRAWAESRPGWTEGEAIQRAGTIAHHAGCPLYVVHITSTEGIEAIEMLRSRGVEIYAEVCIQHLTTTMNSDFGGLAKVNPPLRSEEHIMALWDAIRRGVIDTVATDHVAHTKAKARNLIWEVMPGFSGSATMLPALLTYGYHQRNIDLSAIAALTSRNAANIFGLKDKGTITIGSDADLVLVDLDRERVVYADDLQSAADYSLYQGQTLKGFPTLVILRGRVAMQDGVIQNQPGDGKFIRRNTNSA